MDQEIEQLSSILEGIDSTSLYTQCMEESIDQYSKNLTNLRGIYISTLYERKGNCKNAKDFDEYISAIYSKPARSFTKFSPMFSQFFIRTIYDIHNTPDQFVDTTLQKLKENELDLYEFAYSTFPSLYSYFAVQDFTFTGANFLKQIILKSDNYTFISELVNSFFLSCTDFYECFWNVLSARMIHTLGKPIDYKSVLSKTLELTTPKLTRQHIDIIVSFVHKFSFRAVSFLLINLIKNPFEKIIFSTNLFLDNEINRGFNDFIDYLTEEDNMEVAATLFSIFYKSSTTLFPALSILFNKTAIPFLFSYSDVETIYSILKICYRVPKSLQTAMEKSLKPVRFEMYLSLKNNTFGKDAANEMFGVQFIRPIEVEGNERLWKMLCEDQRANNGLLIDSVRKAINDFPSQKEYLQTKLIMKYETNYNLLNTYFDIFNILSRLKANEESIMFRLSVILCHLSFGIINRMVKSGNEKRIRKRIEHAVETISLTRVIPSFLQFEFTCCALNAVKIYPSDKLQKIENLYIKTLYSWVASNAIESHGRMAQISLLLSNIPLTSFGNRLRQMIEFIRRFDALFGEEVDEEWLKNLFIIIYTYPGKEFFTSFLFFYHSILTSDTLIEKWDDNTKKLWYHLSFGLMCIAKTNNKLYEFANDPEKCSTLFYVVDSP